MMKATSESREQDFTGFMNALKTSDLTEAEKIATAFDHITGSIVEHAQYEIELGRAMNDQEAVVKQQIKMESLKHARGIFATCYKMMTGREAWDE